jgi:hypothetical protein
LLLTQTLLKIKKMSKNYWILAKVPLKIYRSIDKYNLKIFILVKLVSENAVFLRIDRTYFG